MTEPARTAPPTGHPRPGVTRVRCPVYPLRHLERGLGSLAWTLALAGVLVRLAGWLLVIGLALVAILDPGLPGGTDNQNQAPTTGGSP